MTIRFHCPKCGKHFKVRDELAGKSGRCPCGSHIRIPVSNQQLPAPEVKTPPSLPSIISDERKVVSNGLHDQNHSRWKSNLILCICVIALIVLVVSLAASVPTPRDVSPGTSQYQNTTQYKGEEAPLTVVTVILAIVILLIFPASLILIFVSMWKVFTKAGQPGWAILIPIYNNLVFLRIAGKPAWWLLWSFFPIIGPLLGIIFSVLTISAIASNFGKSAWFTAGLIFLPFVYFQILAFGEAYYIEV